MIFCSRKINNIRYKTKIIKCRNYTNDSPDALKEDISKIDFDPIFNNSTDVESVIIYFTSALEVVFNKNSPQIEKRVKGDHVLG